MQWGCQKTAARNHNVQYEICMCVCFPSLCSVSHNLGSLILVHSSHWQEGPNVFSTCTNDFLVCLQSWHRGERANYIPSLKNKAQEWPQRKATPCMSAPLHLVHFSLSINKCLHLHTAAAAASFPSLTHRAHMNHGRAIWPQSFSQTTRREQRH